LDAEEITSLNYASEIKKALISGHSIEDPHLASKLQVPFACFLSILRRY